MSDQGDFAPALAGATQTSVTVSSSTNVSGARILTGIVNSNGTIAGGTGFTVNHSSTGTYVISITTAFPATPTVVAIVNGAFGFVSESSGATASGFTIQTESTGGALADVAFNFIAVATS